MDIAVKGGLMAMPQPTAEVFNFTFSQLCATLWKVKDPGSLDLGCHSNFHVGNFDFHFYYVTLIIPPVYTKEAHMKHLKSP